MGEGLFFTRDDANKVRRVGTRRSGEVSSETLASLGPAGVKNMNPKAKHPEMPPTGAAKPLVYVLGESPSFEDDKVGKPFAGESGERLRDAIPRWAVSKTRFDNIVRTRVPTDRKPRREEIECFRGVVTKSIEDAAPKLILAAGAPVLEWFTGLNSLAAFAGKLFPVQVGNHRCWMMPVMSPSLILRIQETRYDKVPGKEWTRLWERAIERAYEEDLPEPVIMSAAEAEQGIQTCMTVESVLRALDHLSTASVIGWDVETSGLRPYLTSWCVLSIALSDGETTYTIPLDHDETPWSAGERTKVLRALREFFSNVNGPKKVAHNLPFDIEHLCELLGEDVLKSEYGCSLQAAYALDPGPPGDKGAGGHALEDLCIQHFGLRMKQMSSASKMVARLREVALELVLRYNAIDAKLCVLLYMKLMKLVKKQGVTESYERQMDRIPAVVMAQRIGVPIDQEETKRLRRVLDQDIESEVEKLRANPNVVEYEEKFGVFNPASAPDVGKLLVEVLGEKAVKTAAGGVSTSKLVLEELKVKHPVVEHLTRLRSLEKLRGTYVDRFLIDHPESYVSADGRVHCRFSISRTRSYRLSSEEPNNQNWPKRKHKEVRKQMSAPPGWSFVAVDQGQIEGRTIAMESCDPAWVDAIFRDYDVHSEWAGKLAEIDRGFAAIMKRSPKEARGEAKNGLVFPLFYGSSAGSVIAKMGLEDEKAAEELFDEFWTVFAGVKKWQQESWERYKEEGCVWSLSGRRRLGPLSFNMVVNTPPQADASDICVDAMVRLADRAMEEDARFLFPLVQIHDDLTFLMPDSELSYGIGAVVKEQLGFKAPWVNVPLMVEVEVGKNLLEMEHVGKWRSDQI